VEAEEDMRSLGVGVPVYRAKKERQKMEGVSEEKRDVGHSSDL